MTKNKIKSIAIRVNEKLYDQLVELSEKQDRSISSTCRHLMQKQLEQQRREEYKSDDR